MTIREFFKSVEKLAIHCNREDKARALLKAFDDAGYKWINGTRYTEDSSWDLYKECTCYSNGRGFCEIEWYEDNDYKVLEFEDIEI